MNHTFPTYQHLIDRTIMTERKRREMEDRKRKIGGPQTGSSSRPRYSGSSPQQFKQGHQHQYHRQFPQQQQQQQYRRNNQPGGNQYQRQNNQATRLPAPATNQNGLVAPAQVGGRVCFYCAEQTTRRRTIQRKQLSSRQQSMPQQDKERHSKHQESMVKPTTVER